MIEAKELRIGNMVKYCASFVQITSVPKIKLETIYFNFGSNENYCAYIKEISPILITEEWLLKCGFKPCNMNYRFVLGRFTYNIGSGWFFGNEKIRKQIHVHQFQNTYFSFTGEELTISVT